MNYLGSKQIETARLLLKAQTMQEQKRLWEILMIPEVNRYFLTENIIKWIWTMPMILIYLDGVFF